MNKIFVLAVVCTFLCLNAEARTGVCKPAIEANTKGIKYEKIVDLYVKAKKVHDQVRATEGKVAVLDQAINQAYDHGLDAIVQAIRDLGYDLKPEAKFQRQQMTV
jgi:hypothetical protein